MASRRLGFAVAILVWGVGVGACGSDDGPTGSPAQCAAGDTRVCTGPGACAGGQVCSADGTWSACDCGGGTGGVGGTAGADAGVGGASGSQTGGAAGSAGAPPCPAGHGPVMVDVGKFCIDSTEVTQAQYAEFLAAKGGDLSGQSPGCENQEYDPLTGLCTTNDYDPVKKAQYPVTCTDWCDTDAYCRWAGKRTCGFVGGAVPSAPKIEDLEWMYACTQGGTSQFSYGDGPKPLCVLNGMPSTPEPVKSAPECHGVTPPFDQVYDLLGNAWEWGGPSYEIRTAMGYSATQSSAASCGGFFYTGGGDMEQTAGFRCCADQAQGQ